MKKIILWAMLLFIAAASFSQEADPSEPLTPTDYLQKSKNQKTAAWVLLGGGAIINIAALATLPNDYISFAMCGGPGSSSQSKANTSATLFIVGSASMLASIPFFHGSRLNKKKALSMTIEAQQLLELRKTNIYTIKYPALTMKIRL